jgi:hypothetical protein
MANSLPEDFLSLYSRDEVRLDADPQSRFWLDAPPVSADHNPSGEPVPGIRTTIRSRWTDRDLFLQYECVYQTLYLKPSPQRSGKTWELWNWDVAELFIGDDWEHIERYKEFEISPQGEWVDLAIDRNPPDLSRNRDWTSGFESSARIDAARSIWYGAMRIPFAAITPSPIAAGKKFRANLYRIEGPPEKRKLLCWQPTHSHTFHVPKAYGNLVLIT